MKYPFIAALLFLGLHPDSTMAQSEDAAENKQILAEKNFVFIAQRVNPQRGASRQLTSRYDLTVNPDTVAAELPFFGRAYVAPIDPTQGGIHFTSVDFSYEAKDGRKKRHEITIRPKDSSCILTLQLTAYENGRATLQVTQLNRDPISFTGYFIAGPDRPKKAF